MHIFCYLRLPKGYNILLNKETKLELSMKRVIMVAMGLLLTAGLSYSQIKVNVGVSTTINSTFVLDKGLNADPSYVRVSNFEMAPLGFTFGAHFNNKFALSLEGILTNYKQKYDIKEKVAQAQQTVDNIAELDFDMQYLHLPMMIKFMGGGDNKARMNFSFGPQLSLLTSGAQTLLLDPSAAGQIISIPDIPEGADIDDYIPGATALPDGTFQMPNDIPTDPIQLLGKEGSGILSGAEEKFTEFKGQEFHLMAAVGLDFDVSKNLYVSMNIKADYSLTDMRNGDLIEQLKAGSLKDITGNRANLAIGAQITLNYMFGGTRSFKSKG